MKDKELSLQTLMLLSALESWAYSLGAPLPAHIRKRLETVTEQLKEEVLNGNTGRSDAQD